jgi:hypothetical protein
MTRVLILRPHPKVPIAGHHQKPTNNPSDSTDPSAAITHEAFQTITTVESVRSVGCKWSFLPGGISHSFPRSGRGRYPPFRHNPISPGGSGKISTALNATYFFGILDDNIHLQEHSGSASDKPASPPEWSRGSKQRRALPQAYDAEKFPQSDTLAA